MYGHKETPGERVHIWCEIGLRLKVQVCCNLIWTESNTDLGREYDVEWGIHFLRDAKGKDLQTDVVDFLEPFVDEQMVHLSEAWEGERPEWATPCDCPEVEVAAVENDQAADLNQDIQRALLPYPKEAKE